MTAQFALTDYIIFIVYAALILGVGLYVSRSKDGKEKSAEDYFSRVNRSRGGPSALR